MHVALLYYDGDDGGGGCDGADGVLLVYDFAPTLAYCRHRLIARHKSYGNDDMNTRAPYVCRMQCEYPCSGAGRYTIRSEKEVERS